MVLHTNDLICVVHSFNFYTETQPRNFFEQSARPIPTRLDSQFALMKLAIAVAIARAPVTGYQLQDEISRSSLSFNQ